MIDESKTCNVLSKELCVTFTYMFKSSWSRVCLAKLNPDTPRTFVFAFLFDNIIHMVVLLFCIGQVIVYFAVFSVYFFSIFAVVQMNMIYRRSTIIDLCYSGTPPNNGHLRYNGQRRWSRLNLRRLPLYVKNGHLDTPHNGQ